MENTIITKNNLAKCDSIIKILSISTLVFTVLCYFFSLYSYWPGELTFLWCFDLQDIFPMLLSFPPAILLVLYIFKLYSKPKAKNIIATIFCFLCLKIFVDAFFGYGYRVGHGYSLLKYEHYRVYRYNGMHQVLTLVILVFLILAIISALAKLNKRIFIIISMSIGILNEVIALTEVLDSSFYMERPLYQFTNPLNVICAILFYTTLLLLFGFKNKISDFIFLSPQKENVGVEKISPEQALILLKEKTGMSKNNPELALKLLKEKLDIGMITEEEYQAQRTEIIKKL